MGGGFTNVTCLRVAVISYLPHVAILSEGPNPKVGGTLSSVLDILAQQLGFCYEYMVPQDLVYGKVLENGTLTGSLAAVVSGEADMTGLLTVNEARMRHLDFTVPLFVEQIHVAVRRPVLEPDMAGFVKPFTIFVRLSD
ncbi:glutamate receptor-like [Scylla paramamosain]|uniref:glutamate receptor-like n=1 Tax=Scylla paramamosain TaxID=85552 RepID=UPI0030828FC4